MSKLFPSFFKLQAPSSKLKANRGFTLIEMTVVIAVFLITTAIVLTNFGSFRDKTSLDLLAQEIALVIRQAQVYGSATRFYDPELGAEFPSYGVYLISGETGFVLFADTTGSGVIIPGGQIGEDSPQTVERFNLYGGAFISAITYNDDDPLDYLNITFPRPAPGAEFRLSSGPPETYSHVTIRVSNPKGDSRDIVIWNTGHVYVDSNVTP